MLIGLLMLTAAWGLTLNGWVICYAWSLFFYGIGVGKDNLICQLKDFHSNPLSQVVNIP